MKNNRFPLTKIKQGFICAEIGVWRGEFSEQILRYNPKLLYLIDPWISQFDNRIYSIEQDKMDTVYDSVVQKFSQHKNVIIQRCFSTKINIDNSIFDWIYIDGDHSYISVLADLNFYFPLMRRGGYLCGDDYGWNDKYSNGGPKRAVDEFISKHKLKLEIKNDQFVIQV
jgi:cephalosporin hydroxylase